MRHDNAIKRLRERSNTRSYYTRTFEGDGSGRGGNRPVKHRPVKMMNLHTLNEHADQMMTVLGEYGGEPELKAAIGLLVSFKMLIKTYSDRLRETPFKSIKEALPDTRYEGYFTGHGFDDAQSVFQDTERKRREDRDKAEQKVRDDQFERDSKGRFS